MKEEGKKKIFLVRGDVVQFVLISVASFTKGNFFEGTVAAIVPKEFSVRIRPTNNALKKVKCFTDSMGLITVPFRCVRIKSIKAHREQIRLNRLAEEQAKEERLKKGLQALYESFVVSLGKNKPKRPPKKKKSYEWVWRP